MSHTANTIGIDGSYQPTDAQEHMIDALDDVAEHVMYEWDRPDPSSIGTAGFAHITNIDGRGSFVRRITSLADAPYDWIDETRHNEYTIDIGAISVQLSPDGRGNGYRLSITNMNELVGGPAHQRLDVRREVHQLFLDRMRDEWGYFSDRTRVYGRVD